MRALRGCHVSGFPYQETPTLWRRGHCLPSTCCVWAHISIYRHRHECTVSMPRRGRVTGVPNARPAAPSCAADPALERVVGTSYEGERAAGSVAMGCAISTSQVEERGGGGNSSAAGRATASRRHHRDDSSRGLSPECERCVAATSRGFLIRKPRPCGDAGTASRLLAAFGHTSPYTGIGTSVPFRCRVEGG